MATYSSILILSNFLATTAAAQVIGVLLPPKEFDYKPEMAIIDTVLPSDILQKECRSLPWAAAQTPRPDQIFNGCSIKRLIDGRVTCVIWRINNNLVKRHEYGHCNGWPWNHPNTEQLAKITTDAQKYLGSQKLDRPKKETPPTDPSTKNVFDETWDLFYHNSKESETIVIENTDNNKCCKINTPIFNVSKAR